MTEDGDSSVPCNPWAPLGAALMAFHRGREDATVIVECDVFATESFDAGAFYRPEGMELPALEQAALGHCYGKVLDVGAGAGRHALELQRLGHEVVALDIASEAAAVMTERGVRDARVGDLSILDERFDTILMLMNGIGVAGTCTGLSRMLARLTQLLNTGGQIICDSADLQTEIDVTALRNLRDDAIGDPELGEVYFRLQLDDQVGDWYPWLFASAPTLEHHARAAGLLYETLAYGERGSFLARMSLPE